MRISPKINYVKLTGRDPVADMNYIFVDENLLNFEYRSLSI